MTTGMKDETIGETISTEQATPDALPTLRLVAWTNIWNRSAAVNSDGHGTKHHVTSEAGYSGKTLCGRTFPEDKGYPSTWGAGVCKRCANRAYAMGFEKGFTRGLKSVPSIESY